MPRLYLLFLIAGLAACTSTSQRIDRAADEAQLQRRLVSGAGYQHVIYMKPEDRTHGRSDAALQGRAARLLVFLDGDGRPWSDGGRRPASDPTTRNPIALRLLANTPAPGIYISRPCYQQLTDVKCSSDTWTSGRYADEIVASLVAAIRTAAHEAGARQIVLIGYSGGGTLAVLVGERLERVAAVITVAANLDIEAWAQHHHYLPLATSLNPAASDRQHPWTEIHVSGALDTVVPSITTSAYFKRYPAAQRWIYPEYDHVCCWVEQWREVWNRVEEVTK